jgi:ATP-dependent RNA helicase HelY
MRRGPFPRRRRPRRPEPEVNIQAGADQRLTSVFAQIGVPEQTPFTPDAFQREAVDAVRQTDCLVTAPTGAGKTWIAEQAIRQVFENGGRAWYACPLKALSNAKFTEFAAIFGAANVGILTGDRREQPDAPIIIGTTEILRNQLYDAMHTGIELETDFVVLDEAHFLGDYDRGVVWEEIMIYLPTRVPLLLLSATIGNAKEIADWLSAIRRRECRLIQESQRPVPLYPLYFAPSGTLLPLVSTTPQRQIPPLQKSKRPGQPEEKAILGPALGAAAVRRHAGRAEDLRSAAGHFLSQITGRLRQRPETLHAQPHPDDERNTALVPPNGRTVGRQPASPAAQAALASQNLGIGAHHSGQLPAWKLVLETLMSEGLLDAVFATSTVAAGVNFPARTILFQFRSLQRPGLRAPDAHRVSPDDRAGRAARQRQDRLRHRGAEPLHGCPPGGPAGQRPGVGCHQPDPHQLSPWCSTCCCPTRPTRSRGS